MTYSIVARDPASGAVGVAAATGLVAIGALVPHVRWGAGAVATQGWATNPLYGPDGLDLMAGGTEAETALAALTRADAGRESRQAILIDRAGRAAGWTGADNREVAATICEANVAVAGNMLPSSTVLPEMLRAFHAAKARPLEHRLAAALEAAERAGGDRRGTCSAALRVDDGRGYASVDLRIDHDDQPTRALTRLLDLHAAPEYQTFLDRLPKR